MFLSLLCSDRKAVRARNRKSAEGTRVNPHSSLAVFYVEQVALNRHVLVQYRSENKVGCNRVKKSSLIYLRNFLTPDPPTFALRHDWLRRLPDRCAPSG